MMRKTDPIMRNAKVPSGVPRVRHVFAPPAPVTRARASPHTGAGAIEGGIHDSKERRAPSEAPERGWAARL
jgi:hypothetical protein